MKLTTLFLLVLILPASVLADGVMRPTTISYPQDFLRTRMTKVDVSMVGQCAMTTVYQEFVNESNDSTDAVYSFPLPPDARATAFYFWSNDTLFLAPLKIKEQATNPGTGEGGIDALLTDYLGSNAIRVLVHSIHAHAIQKIRLEYISFCPYVSGKISYSYPLATAAFVTYPLDFFSFTVHLNATDDILSDTLSAPGSMSDISSGPHARTVTATASKLYPVGTDITYSYTTATPVLGFDLFSASNDSMDGHFVFVLKPPSSRDTSTVLHKNIVFVVDRSSSTAGAPLDESKNAIGECIARMNEGDRFNILAFNYGLNFLFSPNSLPATAGNISTALAYLSAITASGGSDLNTALQAGINSFGADTAHCIILLFSDGRSPVMPATIKAANTINAGIFPIAVSKNPDRSRLEMLSYMNYGFPTFLLPTDPIRDIILDVFDRVNDPIMKDVRMEVAPNAYDLLPAALHTVYQGSRFFLTGRFTSAVSTMLSIAGMSRTGPMFADLPLAMSADKKTFAFAEKFWAKEKLDDLERYVAVYGESDSLKNLMISVSLRYGLRCKYTAYIADKTHPVTNVPASTALAPRLFTLAGNFPNPFNPGTTIRFSTHGMRPGVATIRIYNILGQLIATMTIVVADSGQFDVYWNGMSDAGRVVPSGVYLYTVELHGTVLRGSMVLVK